MGTTIKLETAKELKLITPNIYCKNAYVNIEYLREYHIAESFYKYTCKEEFPLVMDASNFMIPRSEPFYPAPFQTDLQEWFRKLYFLHPQITWEIHMKWFYEVVKVPYTENDTKICYGGREGFNSYEEALEDALQHMLRLIKFKK
jgi:hypothetical protein